MFKNYNLKVGLVVLVALISVTVTAYAAHSWGSYHWARTANPFTLKLGDNVSSVWDAYLGTTSADWSLSNVLDTTIVTGGTNPKNCRATSGRVEVCSAKYGFNGWLGIAQIWINGNGHIVKGTTKVNDSYFNTSTYNKPGWRNLVMCQEVGHAFGLDHQDEVFGNANLGTCMDYTDDPDGTLKSQLSNEHPNAHDYEQLEAIYAHLDSVTTVGQVFTGKGNNGNEDGEAKWGKSIRKDGNGRPAHYVHDLGNGEKVFTFVIWTE